MYLCAGGGGPAGEAAGGAAGARGGGAGGSAGGAAGGAGGAPGATLRRPVRSTAHAARTETPQEGGGGARAIRSAAHLSHPTPLQLNLFNQLT